MAEQAFLSSLHVREQKGEGGSWGGDVEGLEYTESARVKMSVPSSGVVGCRCRWSLLVPSCQVSLSGVIAGF